MVPASNSPASARSVPRSPFASRWSRIQRILGPAKYVDSGRPVVSRNRSAPAGCPSASRAQIPDVRVSCHTIALYTGFPVALSHTTTVSRWLVMPIARTSAGSRSTSLATCAIAFRTLVQISMASCSTQPACGKICLCSICAVAAGTGRPSSSNRIALVDVVPWSMAKM